MSEVIEKDFINTFDSIKEDIRSTQFNIMINANINIVNLYYRVGKVLYENSKWGNKFIDQLAFEIKLSFPSLKGFSSRNLKYMKTFYEECKDNVKIVQLVAQLPWGHNIKLIEKVKNIEERQWYIEKCLEEGWSKSVLLYQIETNLYYRQVKSIKHNNFNLTLKSNSDLASNIMKDPYVFDIIDLKDNFKEKDLEDGLINKLEKFIIELDKGFSLIGRQYKVTIENQDFYIDLLFYHYKLKCFVAFELKVTEFKPEYASKMAFYLTTLDEQIKEETDNPSIGIILCQSKKDKIVDYTLKYINKPIGVSEYKIYNKLTKEVLKCLPTKEEIIMHIE